MGTNYCVETATLRWFLRILTDGVTSPGQNVFDIKSGIIITSSIADGFVAIFATIIRKIRKIVRKKNGEIFSIRLTRRKNFAFFPLPNLDLDLNSWQEILTALNLLKFIFLFNFSI